MLTLKKDNVSCEALAMTLGLTARRVQQLAAEGVLSKEGKGHYPFPQCVHEYCAYLRAESGDETMEELKREDLRVKIAERRQNMQAAKDALISEALQDAFEAASDFLAEYRSRIQKLAVDEKTMKELNRILDETQSELDSERDNAKADAVS